MGQHLPHNTPQRSKTKRVIKMRSVDSITFNSGRDNVYLVAEHTYQRPVHAHDSIKETGKRSRFYKIGDTPWFLNGEPSTRSEVIEALAKLKSKSRTTTRITFCTDEAQGFERAVSVRIFPSFAAFERSPFCRRFTYFTDTQKEHHKFLTK